MTTMKIDPPTKLDKDIQILWDEVNTQLDAEMEACNKRGEFWSSRIDALAEIHIALLTKQMNRELWRWIWWMVGFTVLTIVGIFLFAHK